LRDAAFVFFARTFGFLAGQVRGVTFFTFSDVIFTG
jgi:hypothetical protein